VRLAQRIPVRVHIDEVPDGVVLAAGNDRDGTGRSSVPNADKWKDRRCGIKKNMVPLGADESEKKRQLVARQRRDAGRHPSGRR
jgi:hypothetical protein